MDDHAFDRLPETYAAALRLRRRGLSNTDIATALELEPQAAEALLALAEAKLATLSSNLSEPRQLEDR